MEIHRFEKVWLAAAILLIVGFIATITYGAVGAGVAMVSDSGGTVDSAALNEHPEFSDPGVRQVGENRYEVYVVAQQFVFEPGTGTPIELPAGSTVTFYVTSADVVHGFNLAGTNLNTMAIPGQVAEVTVEFPEEPKNYAIICHEYCGSGHHEMAGNLRTVPPSEFNLDGSSSADVDADADAADGSTDVEGGEH
ncbi:MAG: cytochrome c oxidase subunit II [Haloarculaceae archaeon]